jgi:hypothetical protein
VGFASIFGGTAVRQSFLSTAMGAGAASGGPSSPPSGLIARQVLAQLRATPWAHFAGAVLGLLDFDAAAALRSYQGPRLHLHSGFLEEQNLVPIHAQVPRHRSNPGEGLQPLGAYGPA